MIQQPGRMTSKSEQLTKYYLQFVPEKYWGEKIIVHHVTEDSGHRMQLEVERRVKGKFYFECVVL